METLKLTVVTPNGLIFEGDVTSVTLPGKEGEFGVLPGHVSVISLLTAGIIEYQKTDGVKDCVAINWGHVNVTQNSVDILAEGAISLDVSSDSEISQALKKAEELLNDIQDSDKILSSVKCIMEHSSQGHI
jgi:F-type H+-transporting ATPase subunit epsilon